MYRALLALVFGQRRGFAVLPGGLHVIDHHLISFGGSATLLSRGQWDHASHVGFSRAQSLALWSRPSPGVAAVAFFLCLQALLSASFCFLASLAGVSFSTCNPLACYSAPHNGGSGLGFYTALPFVSLASAFALSDSPAFRHASSFVCLKVLLSFGLTLSWCNGCPDCPSPLPRSCFLSFVSPSLLNNLFELGRNCFVLSSDVRLGSQVCTRRPFHLLILQ